MKRTACVFTVLVAMVALIGCGSREQAPVLETDSSLTPEEQRDLRRTLIGNTWVVKAVSATANYRNLEEKTSRIIWEFEDDETVRMSMEVAENVPYAGGMNKSGVFNWTLEGRELTFTGGDARKRFRVLSWSDERMMWLNYEGDDYFALYPEE